MNRVEINDLLPFYEQLLDRLYEEGIEPSDAFGSSSEEPRSPDDVVLFVGEGCERSKLSHIVQLVQNCRLDFVCQSSDPDDIGRIVIGSYLSENDMPIDVRESGSQDILKVLGYRQPESAAANKGESARLPSGVPRRWLGYTVYLNKRLTAFDSIQESLKELRANYHEFDVGSDDDGQIGDVVVSWGVDVAVERVREILYLLGDVNLVKFCLNPDPSERKWITIGDDAKWYDDVVAADGETVKAVIEGRMAINKVATSIWA